MPARRKPAAKKEPQHAAQTVALLGVIQVTPAQGPEVTCDVSLDLALTLPTRLAQVTGEVCGRAVSETFSWAEDE